MIDDRPWFLIIKAPANAEARLGEWTAAVEQGRGTVLAAAPAPAVEVLEPGSAHSAFFLARFAFESDLLSCWGANAALVPGGAQALGCIGLPYEGWPGHIVPTIATVMVPQADRPRAYMLIEGSVSDEARIDRYRDIILPMLRERGAYYLLFELGGNVRVLAGEWSQGILAVSRWPAVEPAHDFWFSELYQKTAIPTRIGAGTFEVQLAEGLAG